jgi:multiple sugar transport system ATP-binding protein
MVFQNYALYPHMSVAENMAFALKIGGVSKEDQNRRVHEAAQLLDLEDLLDRKPAALSGGQRQRVAMGRAIVREPAVFLMDEPLSNLDAKLRVSTRTQIAALQARLGVTTVYVTHDQVEAMTMGDRVVVMNDGVLQQADTPLGLYEAPANVFVAGFIGSPAMNLFTVDLVPEGARLGEVVLPVPPNVLAAARARGLDKATYGVRPESLQITDDQGLSVSATVIEALGSDAYVYGTLVSDGGGKQVVARVNPRRPPRKGDVLRLVPTADEVHIFDFETGERVVPAAA